MTNDELRKIWLANLKNALEKRKISQVKLLQLMNIEKQNLSSILRGTRNASPELLLLICSKIEAQPHEIFNIPDYLR